MPIDLMLPTALLMQLLMRLAPAEQAVPWVHQIGNPSAPAGKAAATRGSSCVGSLMHRHLPQQTYCPTAACAVDKAEHAAAAATQQMAGARQQSCSVFTLLSLQAMTVAEHR